MFALISDIHSNIEALSTVLDDIEKKGIKKVFCLGDILGYGPNPKECLDMIIDRCELCVLGNHDYAVLFEPTNFNFGAEQAAYYCREELEADADTEAGRRRWEFLGGLKMRRTMRMELDGVPTTIDLVHASPRRPVNEYVFPDDVYTMPTKMDALFDKIQHICFIGHTHLPGVFLQDPDFYAPDELGESYPIVEEEKAIINVGSVGQPRDRDNRASYAYVEGNHVKFVRLEYDFDSTAKKIYSIPMLDNFEADRLSEGR